MARYKLMTWNLDEGEIEVGGQRKSTKKDIEKWISDNVEALGLDFRVGFYIKFRNGCDTYQWRWIKDDKPVKP